MAVHFSSDRMQSVLENHERWWRGALERPLLRGTISDAYPPSHISTAPLLSQANCHDFSISAEALIDAEDARISTCEFIGDGYPVMSLDTFGPGILAAMCGAELDNSSGAVWFKPCQEDISRLQVSYDPDNKWSRRIKDIYRAGLQRWEGSVIMTLPDFGGVMDVLASMIGTENLLYAVVDEPEEVKRVLKQIQTAWYDAFADLSRVLAPQGMYTDWNGLLSRESGYIFQCDFSYMIGPDMFREFVMDTLREDTRRVRNSIYHLDGIHALPHLEQILSLEELDAVQWVYGVGQPGPTAWAQVYRRILDAGKRIMIIDNCISNGFEEAFPHLGPCPYGCIWVTAQQREQAMRLLQLRN